MSRLIDADALITQLGIAHECANCSDKMQAFCDAHPDFGSTCELICEAPTVDAVQVVRCGECKFAELYNGKFSCSKNWNYITADWYCADGERKDDAAD